MSEPMSFFIAPTQRDSASRWRRCRQEQLKEWAAETEIAPASGAVRTRRHVSRGDWLRRSDEARRLLARSELRAAGYPARSARLTRGGGAALRRAYRRVWRARRMRRALASGIARAPVTTPDALTAARGGRIMRLVSSRSITMTSATPAKRMT